MTNFLVEALQHLGIYYTPPHILALGYGDGKTRAYATIAGNPPFGGTMSSDKDPEVYMTENSRCSGCGYWFDESELETLGFVVEESGVAPSTVHGPAVHWAAGYIVCPQCGVQLPYETSS